MSPFLRGYVTAALWSTNDESTPSGGYPLDDNYGPEDIEPATLARMAADCERFTSENAADLEAAYEAWGWLSRQACAGQAGHDFWLTRNRHGTGFWDRDLPESLGDRLTDAAHAFGEVNLFVDDDGTIDDGMNPRLSERD